MSTLPARQRCDSTVQRPYLTSVISHLQNCFPCIRILDAFSILDPKLLPHWDDKKLLTYGDNKLELLLQHYSNGSHQIGADQCRSEWKQLWKLFQRHQTLMSKGKMQDLAKFLLLDDNKDLS